MDQDKEPTKQTAGWERSLGDQLLRRLRMDPDKWTIGDRRLTFLGVVVGLTIVTTAICGYVFGWKWTGLTEPEQRTFWDWLDLLIVPIVLALSGYLFTRSENRRAQVLAERQRAVDREIADERVQEEALQAYLDQMGELLLSEDVPVHDSKEGSKVRTLARARTLTVMRRLDAKRTSIVVDFLREADFMGVDQASSSLLTDIDLRGIDLSKADLQRANLSRAKVRERQLDRAAFLDGATMPNGETYEDWLTDKEGHGEDGENSSSL